MRLLKLRTLQASRRAWMSEGGWLACIFGYAYHAGRDGNVLRRLDTGDIFVTLTEK